MEGQVGAAVATICPLLTETAAGMDETTTTQDPPTTVEEVTNSRAVRAEEGGSMAPEGEAHIQVVVVVGVQEGKIRLDLPKVCLEHLHQLLSLGQVRSHSWHSSSLLHHSLSWGSWELGHTHLPHHHHPFLPLLESSIQRLCCLFNYYFFFLVVIVTCSFQSELLNIAVRYMVYSLYFPLCCRRKGLLCI